MGAAAKLPRRTYWRYGRCYGKLIEPALANECESNGRRPMKKKNEIMVGNESVAYSKICRLDVETLVAILDTVYKGVVCCDTEGRITFFSKSNERFYHLERGAALGKHITEVIKTGRLHMVAQSGKPEIGLLDEESHGKRVRHIIERLPIKRDGKVVGAIAKVMFSDVKKAQELANHFKHLENEMFLVRRQLHDLFLAQYGFDDIIGESAELIASKRLAMQMAGTSSTILIQGESGTGKELFAHAIHQASPRARHPFVRVNCASIPHELFEAEFFGYEEGAFTGARKKGRKGKFQLADKGTIFLDEIGELPIYLQAKLLRVLQEKEVQKIGSDQPITTDFRLIASTNRDLAAMVKNGDFREDLYYRLNVMPITVPPLRDRRDDIPLLCQAFIQDLSAKLDCSVTGLEPDALALLRDVPWPGNIRELRNVLERAVALAQTGLVGSRHVSDNRSHQGDTIISGRERTAPRPLREAVKRAEKKAILAALQATNNNKRQAAKLLGIHRSALYKKLREHGIG